MFDSLLSATAFTSAPSPSSSVTGSRPPPPPLCLSAILLRDGTRPPPPDPRHRRSLCASLSATGCGGLHLHDRSGMRRPRAQPRGDTAAFTSSPAAERGCPCARPRQDAAISASTSAAGRFASTTAVSRPWRDGGLLLPHPRRDAAPPSRDAAGQGVYAASSAVRLPLSSSSTAGRGLHTSLLRGRAAASASLIPSSLLAPLPHRPPPQTPWSPPSVAA